jgi:DNA-3-methyladenine glycosylase II
MDDVARPAMSEQITIQPRGPFSLRAAASFGFGQRDATPDGDAMNLAFALDDLEHHAGVTLRQDADGVVRGEVEGGGDLELVRDQVARILSLDADGEAWMAVGERDPVLGAVQAAHPGQRPVLFHSPYEAAAWSVISARIQHAQAARIRVALSREHGATFALDGEQLDAFPLPQRLLEIDAVAGLTDEKLRRLHGVARAALDGLLDAGRLAALDPDEAQEQVREIRGIGPFYAGLIVVRSSGTTDALPGAENRVLAHAGRLYDGDGAGPLTLERYTEIAEAWHPFRTWASVLIRVHGDREGW